MQIRRVLTNPRNTKTKCKIWGRDGKVELSATFEKSQCKKSLGKWFFFNHLCAVNFINVKYAPENILRSVLLFWLPMTVLVIGKLQSSFWMKLTILLTKLTKLGFQSCIIFVVFSNKTLIMGCWIPLWSLAVVPV